MFPAPVAQALRANGVEIAARVVAGLLKSPEVASALNDIVAHTVASSERSRDMKVDGLRARSLLLVGLSAPAAQLLRRRYATSLTLEVWSLDSPASELLSALTRSHLVILCVEVSAKVRRILDAAGHTYAHQVSGPANLRSILDGLALTLNSAAIDATEIGIGH